MEAAMMQRVCSWAIAIGVVAAAAFVSPAGAQQAFKSADEAANALIAAVRAGDAKAIAQVLGPDASEITSSGDKVQDDNTRKELLAAYDAKHSLTKDAAGRTFLTVGPDDFPIAIPIVEKDGAWRFDAVAGREEILYRRIGRNELAAIQTCLAYVDAQNDYAEMAPNGGVGVYAQRIVSRLGKKDGLYWPAAQGEPESPLGEAVAAATSRGYRVSGARAPFHGYYFRVLTRQGPTASGGAINYVAKGKMIGGFALVAYPAQYGNSGVMTLLVNHRGDVFQKDLGRRTGQIAGLMSTFNPDRTWTKVADTQAQK
jgi:hypothetical protein